MSQKKYWKGLEELNDTEAHQEILNNEFQEELGLSDKLLNAQPPRRDFLKYLGFSTLAATVAASCEMRVRKAVPYATKPDQEMLIPGVANYFASTFIDGGDYCSVVVKSRDGRPIMIEGNELSQITHGSATPRVIASTLSLYDTARLRGPMIGKESVDKYSTLDTKIIGELGAATGAIVLLTGTIVSPTTTAAIATFLAKYPNARHIQYDPVSYTGMLLANEASFGQRALPSYHLERAQTIFSLGADFLGTWLSPAEFGYGYGVNRKVTAANPTMSKHYQVEGMLSMTGANADERATCKPSEYGKIAVALLEAVQGKTVSGLPSKKLNTLINKAAADLKNDGVVLCGSNDKNIQQVVNAINSAIGAYGNTISWGATTNIKKGIDTDMVQLVSDMEAGRVGALIVCDSNPAYDYFDAAKFANGLKKVKTTISLNDRLDETGELCTYKAPNSHWLESWGDAEPKTGYYSFIQPTIANLFKTRQMQDSLLLWAGSTETYHDMFHRYWVAKVGSQQAFDKALQDGVLEPGSPTMSGATAGGDIAAAIAGASNSKGGAYELVIYQKNGIGYGGQWSNNPWLQEMPDPISKATWGNYVCMSPQTAKEHFDAEFSQTNQVDYNKRIVSVKVGNKELRLPVVVIPGMHHQVIAVALGYGRGEGVGMAAANLGENAYPFIGFDGNSFAYNVPVSISKTNETAAVAITQTHHSYENRPILHEYTLAEFKKNPLELINDRKEELSHYMHNSWEEHEGTDEEIKNAKDFDAREFERRFAANGTMYPVHDKQGIHWGMSIDLTSCTGCGACVIACQAENNISVVGKKEVLQVHEMAWIRIDRYFAGDPNDPDTVQTVFQPMICQHCDNAPCENVCPVSATNHSSEGLNQMAYNRCIGTKYCANNCPYKVRRFNWFDWNGADSFADNLYEDGRRDMMNDDVTRMVLNPDVTVRGRGVMEKCTFCVQRLQQGKLDAKQEGVVLEDRHISLACQKACGSDCFTFGNINDTNSEVYKQRYVENKERLFYVLEQLHTLPNVSYMSKIRNTDEIVAASEADGIYKEHM